MQLDGSLLLGGEFWLERWRGDTLIKRYRAKNGLTTAGLNDALETLVRQGTLRTWRIGLIDDTDFDEVDVADTMASHAGWTELTSYDEASRPLWGPAAVTGKLAVNSSSVAFTLSADASIKGLFLSSDGTKGGTTGILLCTGLFDDAAAMLDNEVAKCFYRISVQGR